MCVKSNAKFLQVGESAGLVQKPLNERKGRNPGTNYKGCLNYREAQRHNSRTGQMGRAVHRQAHHTVRLVDGFCI